MNTKKTITDQDTREFIKLMQSLDKEAQAGLLMMIQGSELISRQKKKAT